MPEWGRYFAGALTWVPFSHHLISTQVASLFPASVSLSALEGFPPVLVPARDGVPQKHW